MHKYTLEATRLENNSAEKALKAPGGLQVEHKLAACLCGKEG